MSKLEWGKNESRNWHIVKMYLHGVDVNEIASQLEMRTQAVNAVVLEWKEAGEPKP
jgi:hypothetical protein